MPRARTAAHLYVSALALRNHVIGNLKAHDVPNAGRRSRFLAAGAGDNDSGVRCQIRVQSAFFNGVAGNRYIDGVIRSRVLKPATDRNDAVIAVLENGVVGDSRRYRIVGSVPGPADDLNAVARDRAGVYGLLASSHRIAVDDGRNLVAADVSRSDILQVANHQNSRSGAVRNAIASHDGAHRLGWLICSCTCAA